MEALRGIINKVSNKSKDDDKHSRSGPDASSAYRSSDASGEPDVGTKSYSRDKGGSHDDWDDRRKSDPDTSSSYSSRAGGDSGYSRGSSRDTASGLGSETGDAGRDDNPNYSMMSGEGSSSYTTASSSDNYSGMGRRHNTKKHSRQSGNDDNGDYSSYLSGATGAHVRDDETGEMSRGRGTSGEHGHTSHSVGEDMSRGKHTYGSYASADNNNDYS